MGFYARYVAPRLIDWALGRPLFERERERALAPVYGDVLEVGFGTGLNLAHYPTAVRTLTALDPADMLPGRVGARIARARFPVARAERTAESLPFPDGRFDCVVTTWTLCTIPDAAAALGEMRRVLKPGGLYVFLEHGRSDDARVARRQDFLNPLWKRIGNGCNVNRPIGTLVREAGFAVTTLDRYVLPGEPRFGAEMYRGVATSGA